MYERQSLKELETLRSDVANAAKVSSPSTRPPKPRVILPLEDYSDHPRSAPIAPTTNGSRVATPPTSSDTFNPRFKPALSVDPLPNSQSQQSAPSQVQAFPGLDDPLSPSFLVAPQQAVSTPTLVSPGTQVLPPPTQQTKVAPVRFPGFPGVASSSYQSSLHAPPLDRFDDGSRIRSAAASTSQSTTATLVGSSQTVDPLRSSTQVTATSPSNTSMFQGQQAAGIDPLSQVRSQQMAQATRTQPTRPRLDAREAASKLANMF